METREIIGKLWAVLRHPRTAALALVLLIVIQLLALALPQIPVTAADGAVYSRWLAVLRPTLGEQTRLLASLGLLTIRSSYLLRLTLCLIGLLIFANLDALRDTWREKPWSLREFGPLAFAVGGILVIGGWAGHMLWGWQEPEVIAWPGSDIAVADYGLSVAQPSGPLGLWKGGYGLYILRRGQRTGLEVRATDARGQPLLLLPSVNQDAQETLRLAFTAQEPEAFFALQEAGLIFRLNQLQGAIQVQVYRSASGELLTETALQGSESPLVLQVDGNEIVLSPILLPHYTVVQNPGALFEGLGMGLMAAGSLMRLVTIERERSSAHLETETLSETA